MSKVLEALKRPVLKDDALYRDIADTYFSQKAGTKSQKKKNIPPLAGIAKFSTYILALAIIIPLAVHITSFYHNRYVDLVKKKIAAANSIKVFYNGAVNKELIKNFEFRGYAKNDGSGIVKKIIVLNNPQKYGWADLSIDFKFPADLLMKKLSLSLRGNVGGEKINIVLRDTYNKSYRVDELYLSSNWSDKIIDLEKARGEIDLSKISHLRIECGYAGESIKSSPVGVVIYIKDIGLLKEM